MRSIIMLSETYQPSKNGVVTSIDTFTKVLRKRDNRVIILTSDNKDKDFFEDSTNMVLRFPAFEWPLDNNFSRVFPRTGGCDIIY